MQHSTCIGVAELDSNNVSAPSHLAQTRRWSISGNFHPCIPASFFDVASYRAMGQVSLLMHIWAAIGRDGACNMMWANFDAPQPVECLRRNRAITGEHIKVQLPSA